MARPQNNQGNVGNPGQNVVDSNDPLYIHPSDNVNSVSVDEKLVGSGNYRPWRRCVEIQVSSRRKLGFLTGTVAKPVDDPILEDRWEACNSLVISWIISNVSDSIRRSVLFISSASEIWKQLEKRFNISNGARKFQLNKDVHNTEQNGMSITDYYTKMKTIWEEIDSLNELPKLSVNTHEVRVFLSTLQKQKEEQKLFQFLNGLDSLPTYNTIRSQLLVLDPLPSVEVACSLLQQEETQRHVLDSMKMNVESSAMFSRAGESRGGEVICNACGGKGHIKARCWTVIGYPPWHSKHKQFPQKNLKPKDQNKGGGVNYNKGVYNNRTAANMVHKTGQQAEVSNNASGQLTASQIEQLLKLLPSTSTASQSSKGTYDTDDEMETGFAGLSLKDS